MFHHCLQWSNLVVVRRFGMTKFVSRRVKIQKSCPRTVRWDDWLFPERNIFDIFYHNKILQSTE